MILSSMTLLGLFVIITGLLGETRSNFGGMVVLGATQDQGEEQNEEEYYYYEEEEEEEEIRPTFHEKMTKLTHVDLSEVPLDGSPAHAASLVMERISSNLEQRLTSLYQHAVTPSCRQLIGEHMGYFVNAWGTESGYPFEEVIMENSCPEEIYDFDNLPEGMHIGMIQNRTYQPPANETEYIQDPSQLCILYAILTHEHPQSTIRLVESLYQEGHTFVIHVDGKETSDDTYQAIADYARDKDYVHVLPHPYRVRANWGGFSLVNGTLLMLQYAFGLLPHAQPHSPLHFHKVVHLASTSYPIASNTKIRQTLASYPLDANFMHVIMKPTNPHPESWHYFVECDDRLHRIGRLKPMYTESGGIELYTSSQWFILSREFAQYLARAERGTLVYDMLAYARHVVVADETFFGTVLRNTKFCTKHHNWHFLHLQFDRWESDLDESERNQRKCVMKEKNRCGRSPTILTMDYMDILELSGDLFARKFLDHIDDQIKDAIDDRRLIEELTLTGQAEPLVPFSTDFEGHGTLIVAKETINDDTPLCLGLGPRGNKVRLVPCFHDWVPPTLADGWETGAVIVEETRIHNRWELGPCSTDGHLKRMSNGTMKATPGAYSQTGPKCMLKQVDGLRTGRCIDGDSGKQKRPGGILQVYPCNKKWNQFFSFGISGAKPGLGSIFMSMPGHMVRQIQSTTYPKQEAHHCIGVRGRGNGDDSDWVDDEEEAESTYVYPDMQTVYSNEGSSWLSLQRWYGKQLVSTSCSNSGGTIDWLFIPFINEEEEKDQGDASNDEPAGKDEKDTESPSTDEF